MGCYMLSIDGYWYKIGRNPLKRHVCMPCVNGNHYNVYLDKYIQSSDYYLYRLINENINGGVWMTGQNGMSYYVENRKFGGEIVKDPDQLDDNLCQKPEIPQLQPTQQPPPTPIIKVIDGEGSVSCNDEGVCEVDAKKGSRLSIKKPKGYDVKTNGTRYWLDKQKN
ncbi:MAG: hypothetical protein EU548_06705 [Promethearchaeota archaeon]|nr:MAG: hypothetical protein EU548_06705 [Candidatus Lokiarchaeota archaeon]